MTPPISLTVILALEGLWPIDIPVTEEAFSDFRPQEWAVHVLKFEGCSGVLVGPNHLFITNSIMVS